MPVISSPHLPYTFVVNFCVKLPFVFKSYRFMFCFLNRTLSLLPEYSILFFFPCVCMLDISAYVYVCSHMRVGVHEGVCSCV